MTQLYKSVYFLTETWYEITKLFKLSQYKQRHTTYNMLLAGPILKT